MLKVGLTGGMGTGKATVARSFGRLGALIIDADEIAREVVKPGTRACRELVKAFGGGILDSTGCIDRHRLSSLAFRDMRSVKRLDSIVHPPVIKEIKRRFERAEEEGGHAVIVANVPLLFEAGLETEFDKVITVICPQEEQIRRCRERNGLSREEIERRLKAQLPLEKKVKRSDYVIVNEGSLEDTERQVKRVWDKLVKQR